MGRNYRTISQAKINKSISFGMGILLLLFHGYLTISCVYLPCSTVAKVLNAWALLHSFGSCHYHSRSSSCTPHASITSSPYPRRWSSDWRLRKPRPWWRASALHGYTPSSFAREQGVIREHQEPKEVYPHEDSFMFSQLSLKSDHKIILFHVRFWHGFLVPCAPDFYAKS